MIIKDFDKNLTYIKITDRGKHKFPVIARKT